MSQESNLYAIPTIYDPEAVIIMLLNGAAISRPVVMTGPGLDWFKVKDDVDGPFYVAHEVVTALHQDKQIRIGQKGSSFFLVHPLNWAKFRQEFCV